MIGFKDISEFVFDDFHKWSSAIYLVFYQQHSNTIKHMFYYEFQSEMLYNRSDLHQNLLLLNLLWNSRSWCDHQFLLGKIIKYLKRFSLKQQRLYSRTIYPVFRQLDYAIIRSVCTLLSIAILLLIYVTVMQFF